jgi:hypothetical protein
MRQLKIGAHMVVPVGADPRSQELIRITRVDEDEYEREDIADVGFVPLIGKEGWESEDSDWQTKPPRVVQTRPAVSVSLPGLIAKLAETFVKLEEADLEPLLHRIGDARVVLIGEASHGTSEFYRMRARITQRLIEAKRFAIVAAEADWPDAARIDNYVRHREVPPSEWTAFARFPTWMWRNEETRGFIDWLHARNSSLDYGRRTAFYGLDLYSLYTSVRAVIAIWKRSIPISPPSPGNAMAASHRGRPTLPPMAARRCGGFIAAASRLWLISSLGCFRNDKLIRPATASASSMPRRTPGWWPMPSTTTGSCTTALEPPGITATLTCSKH